MIQQTNDDNAFILILISVGVLPVLAVFLLILRAMKNSWPKDYCSRDWAGFPQPGQGGLPKMKNPPPPPKKEQVEVEGIWELKALINMYMARTNDKVWLVMGEDFYEIKSVKSSPHRRLYKAAGLANLISFLTNGIKQSNHGNSK